MAYQLRLEDVHRFAPLFREIEDHLRALSVEARKVGATQSWAARYPVLRGRG